MRQHSQRVVEGYHVHEVADRRSGVQHEAASGLGQERRRRTGDAFLLLGVRARALGKSGLENGQRACGNRAAVHALRQTVALEHREITPDGLAGHTELVRELDDSEPAVGVQPFGEELLAVVQPIDGHVLDSDQIRAFLGTRLASFKVPRTIEVRHALPREESGKIKKRVLRDPYWANAGRAI